MIEPMDRIMVTFVHEVPGTIFSMMVVPVCTDRPTYTDCAFSCLTIPCETYPMPWDIYVDTHAEKCAMVWGTERNLWCSIGKIIMFGYSVGSKESFLQIQTEAQSYKWMEHDSQKGKQFHYSQLSTSDCFRRLSRSSCPGPLCSADISTPAICVANMAAGVLLAQRLFLSDPRHPYEDFTLSFHWYRFIFFFPFLCVWPVHATARKSHFIQ